MQIDHASPPITNEEGFEDPVASDRSKVVRMQDRHVGVEYRAVDSHQDRLSHDGKSSEHARTMMT